MLSPFHNGLNDRREMYNDIVHVFRNGERCEHFIGLAERKQPAPQRGVTINGENIEGVDDELEL